MISLSDGSGLLSIDCNSVNGGESEAGGRAEAQLGSHERGLVHDKSVVDWVLTRPRGSSIKKLEFRKSRSSTSPVHAGYR